MSWCGIQDIGGGMKQYCELSWRENPIVIDDHRVSMYNDIWIFHNEYFRFMTFGQPQFSHVQSCQMIDQPYSLVLPYTKMMICALYFLPEPKRVLMLGHGSGSLVSVLQKLGKFDIDVVEIDQMVVDVSREYFGFNSSVYTRLHIEDAATFVYSTSDATYDIVFLDVYDQFEMPGVFTNCEMSGQFKRILRDNGLLVVNTFLDPALHRDRLPYHLYWASCCRMVEPVYKRNSVLFFMDSVAFTDNKSAGVFGDTVQKLAKIGTDILPWIAMCEPLDLRPEGYTRLVYDER